MADELRNDENGIVPQGTMNADTIRVGGIWEVSVTHQVINALAGDDTIISQHGIEAIASDLVIKGGEGNDTFIIEGRGENLQEQYSVYREGDRTTVMFHDPETNRSRIIYELRGVEHVRIGNTAESATEVTPLTTNIPVLPGFARELLR